jgi:uncharacterized protein
LATKFYFRSILVILLFGISFSCLSRDLPKRPEPPVLVNDFAGVLSAQDKASLEKKLVAFDDSTSSQLCIVILKTLDGEPASSYAPELFNFWKIGQEGRNNGILILVSMDNPRETFINTGYGLEEFVPDIMAGRIVQEDLLPYFKKEQYYEGLDKASTDLMQMLKGTFKGFKKKSRGQKIPPLAILVVIILGVILISKSKGGGGGHYMRTFGGPGLGGFGGFGGGFGSGGGGSTGGGGAGGSW